MLPNSVSIGPLIIYFYGLIIALSIYIGWVIAKNRAKLYKIQKELFDDPIVLLPLFLGITGARLYHVIDYWNMYSKNPTSILFISHGGLGVWGGLIGAFLGFFIVTKIKKLDLLNVLDLVSPSFILGQAIGRVGNYINQEGFGPPTNMPWSVFIKEENRPLEFINFSHFHPTFFYEALLDLIFFAVIISLSKKFKVKGQVFGLYLVLYSLGRFIVEFWRIDTATIGTLKVAHVFSIIALIIGVLFFAGKTRLDKN